jgi:PST family polysaccharide transporter
MSLRNTFIRSFGWQALNVMSQVVLQLIFISVLARLITTEAFGIMAIALVVVGFIEIFSQIGIGPALIQRKNLTPEHLNGAFWISLVLGILFTAALYFAAPAVAAFYEHEPLIPVLRWIGLSFLISALAIVPRSMIIKELAFKKLFFITLAAMIVGNLIVGLGMAFAGADLWAYVAALLTQNVLMTVGYWAAHRLPIGFKMSRSATADMIRYGGGSTLFNLFNYAATKIDTLIVGKFAAMLDVNAGADARWRDTGLYDRSVYLMGLPITVLGKLSDSVMFSGLSMLQDDPKRLRRAILSAIYHIALLVIPGSVFMIAWADEITVLFLGNQYVDAVPIVQILFISVAFRSLTKVGDSVVRALDRVYSAAAIKAVFFVLVGAGSYFGLAYGLQGVAWAIVGAVMVQFVLMMRLSLRTAGIAFKTMLRKLVPGLIVGAAVYLCSRFLFSFLEGMDGWRLLRLVIALAVNGSVVFALAWFLPRFFRQGQDDILRTLAGRLPVEAFRKRWDRNA